MSNKEKEKRTESEVITDTKVTKKEIVNILQKRIVKVEPIPRPNEWKNLVGEALPQPFMHEGVTREFDLPRSIKTGQFYQIFDNIKKIFTPQFPDEAMTELDFVSRVKGKDLSFTKIEQNFWSGYQDPRNNQFNTPKYSVRIPREGLKLDLSNIDDYIAFRVLEANCKTGWIAPSWNEKDDMSSYMFALVDEKISTDRKKEMIELEMKAMLEFSRIQDSEELLREFLIIKDPTSNIGKSASKEFVFGQVYDTLKSNPKLFLDITNDPYKLDKVFIYKAVKSGAIMKLGKNKYQTPGGEDLGSMGELIAILNDPERQVFRNNIEYQIQNTNF